MSLHLTRLRVEQLRQFRQPFELADIAPGLSIVAGPNEAGKSTLVRAIRAAFFERHRSTSVDDLRPWGDSAAAPTVALDFTLAGVPHQLVKSFLARKRCSLGIAGRSLDGVEAEDHLAQLFGFSFALKGASKPEHGGIPGLLWVEQGSGQTLDVSHARDHLHHALQGAGGGASSASSAAASLAASHGDALLDQLRQQRQALLTSTGKPRAALADAIAQAAALAEQLQALDAQITRYQQQVDQLSVLRQQQQADDQAQPWDALRRTLQAAQQQQQALQASAQQLLADQATLAQLAQTRQLLRNQLAAMAQQGDAATARQLALASASTQLQAADSALAAVRQQADAAQARARAARDAARRARQQAQHQQLGQQLQDAQAIAQSLAAQLARASTEHQRLAVLRASAAALAISAPAVAQLRTLDRAARDAALRHQAVATRLQFTLHGDQRLTLQLGGQASTLQGDGELLLDTPATLQLPGLGSLRITPGGQDLAALARGHDQALHALHTALRAAGLANLAEAEARLARLADLQSQTQLAEQALAIVAPQGLDALQAAVAQAQAGCQVAQQALQRLTMPAAAEQADPAQDAAHADAEKAETAPVDAEQAEADHEAASAADQAAAAALATAQRQQAAAQQQRDSAQRECDAANTLLADPARLQRQADAQQQLLATQADHGALAARTAQAQTQLRDARPDIVAQDIQRLQRSVVQLEADHRQRRDTILLLENTLQQAGALGLEEQRETTAGQLQRAQARQAELSRRAAALDLLCSRLDARRQATLARLQAPLQQRLAHYLPLLLPGATVQMDDSLAPGLITRPAATGGLESGAVDALSFGAREQLGLISRFAYADLLQQAGRPTLLILDDALVHSDAPRLAQMKRVIFDAAQRHQLLLFTCHPEAWRDMGVALRTLG